MKKVIYRLQSYYDNQATEVEKSAIRFLLDNAREVISMDIHSLAKECYCSPATIVRICKKNGFKGYKDFKLALINDISFNDELIRDSVSSNISKSGKHGIIKDIFNENIKAINNTYNLIDYQVIGEVIKLIKKSKIIRLFGIGASFLVCKDFQQKLERINKVSILYEDTHMQLINSNNTQEDDLAIIVSYSGQTREIIDMANNVKSNGTKIISLTQYTSNKLMNIADYNLFVPQIEQKIRLGAGSSRISQLTVIDFLYHTYLSIENEKYMDKILTSNKLLEKEEII